MATTTQSQTITNILAAPATIIGRASKAAESLITKYSANSADKTAIGTWAGTINDVFIVLPLEWDACIHNIKLYNDAVDTNGSPTLTVDVGVGYINRITGTLTVSASTVYASATTLFQGANNGAELLLARSVAKLGDDGEGIVSNTPARVLDDAGLTAVPLGSIPVLLIKAHAAAATAASAPNLAILVSFTM